MHNSKTREAQLQAWKETRNALKPLKARDNRPSAKLAQAKKPAKEKTATADKDSTCLDKENRTQPSEPVRGRSVLGHLKPTVSSRKKGDGKQEWISHMAEELDGLQGDFALFKRDSVRASLAGDTEIPPPSASKAFVISSSPSAKTIAARLQILKRDSFHLLEQGTASKAAAAPSTGLPQPNSSGLPLQPPQPAAATGMAGYAGELRQSMQEFVPFEEAGVWEAPSLASLAEELFNDAAFKEACERGLSMQLKRTKDGATVETRIAELAGVHPHTSAVK